MKNNTRTIGGVLLIMAVLVAFSVFYYNSPQRQTPLVFSPQFSQQELWRSYKLEYIEPGTGRTLDKQRENITTSEGQSYTMLRAAWQGDKETFDMSWTWTRDILQHKDDKLFAWRFGEVSQGNYGIDESKGWQNSATDGDTDIALALIFGYSRWRNETYLRDARDILRDLWDKTVVEIDGMKLLAANDLEKFSASDSVIINPSYLAPYAYRIFSQVDRDHDWNALIDTTYTFLERLGFAELDSQKGVGLFPDWVAVDRNTGGLSSPKVETLTTNYSYDAFRVPWRLGIDLRWFKEKRAEQLLNKSSFLINYYKSQNKIVPEYSFNGTPLVDYEAPSAYGAAMPLFTSVDPILAERLYNEKLRALYDADRQTWKSVLSYYDDNWAWFGMAWYNNQIINLADSIKFPNS
jgi:endoglucanase